MGLVKSGSLVGSTQSQDRAGRLVAAGLVALLAFFGIPRLGEAQDVPPPAPNIQLVPKGSLVIPMDLANQSLVAPFNIRAYGLVNDLLQNNIPVKWAIRAGKAKDAFDFSAQAQRIAPTTGAPTSMSFRGGPFIVDKAYAAVAKARITAFGGSVVAYELTQDASVDIRYDLFFKPRPYVNTTNAGIATAVLDAAGIPNYTVGNDFDLLAGSCFTVVMEPHNTDNTGVSAVRSFLQNGGNFLGQCASVLTYENDTNGLFLTTLGITGNDIGNALAYPNPDLSFSQFEGVLEPAPGGSVEDWSLLPGSVFRNSAHVHADNIGASPPTYAAMAGKLYGGQGGLAFYLGGHDWAGSTLGMVNGQRMILNAVLTPPTRPLSCGLTISLPDLTITKSHSGTFSEGNNGTYTITVSNVGTRSSVDTITVVDTLPAGLGFVSGTGTGWTVSAVGQVVTARLASALAAGGNSSFQLVATVGAAAVPSVVNRSHISGGGEINLANNTASDPTTVIQEADVRVDKVGPAAAQGAGAGTIIYLITTTNDGPSPAQVTVTDTLPPLTQITFLAASRGATRVGRVVTWPAVGLASGNSVTDTVRVRVDAPDTDPDLVNVAAALPSITDPDLSDNRDTVTTDIVASTTADVAIAKVGPATVLTSDTIRYVITATNLGTATADGLVLRDTLPPGVAFISASRGGVPAAGVVTWPAVSLANGATLTDTVTVLSPATAATLLNRAASNATTSDPDPTNNDGSQAAARVTTTVVQVADLSVTKTDGRTMVQQGTPLTYTIVVSNAGPRRVNGATVSDAFPAGLSAVTWTCTPSGGALCGTNSGSGNIAGVSVNLPVGGTVTFSATGTATGTGTLSNTATVALPAGATDPNLTNNSATDADTQIQIPGLTLSSLANQAFNLSQSPASVSLITVTEGSAPSVTAANDLRIRIPPGFPMTWLTSDLNATLSGSAAPKVSNIVRYEDAGRTLVLDVLTNFAAGDVLVIGGLSFANFTALAAANRLQAVVAGAGGLTAATDDKTKRILDPYGITSAVDQRFAVADPATAASLITITDAGGVPTIGTANDIRIRIPTGYPMTWDPTVTTVTLGGSAAGKVNATVKGYEDGNRTVFLEVLTNFAAGDQLTVNGLRFTGFTARAGLTSLELDIDNNQAGDAFDPKTKAIGQPTFTSAATQNFRVGAPVTAISPITVTADPSFPTITAARDIRIRIPAGFPMTWNTADLAATLGGSAAGKVSPTVSYTSGGTVLVLDVLTDFAPGDVLTVSDLGFANFTASAGLNRLQLVVSGAGGGTTALDAKTISIGAPTISSAANQSFVVGAPATAASVITITDDPLAATIRTDKEIRIRIPTGFPMTWNPAITTVTLGGSATAKVKPAVKGYEDGNQTVVLDVDVAFVPGDQLTVTGLQFMNFTSAAPAAQLELDVTDDKIGDAFDDKTKSIGAPRISSAANQNFTVAGAPRTVSTLTVTEDAGAGTITASGNLRIRIPAGFPMTWLTSDLSAVLGGSAAAKVSPTVSYEDAGHTLVLDVLSNFAPGDVLTIAGLSYANFTAVAGLDNLELVVSGTGGGTAAYDDKTISIGAPTISSAVNQIFSVGDPSTGNSIITITDDPVTATIRTDKEIRIRIPTGFNMTWNPSITTVILGGPAAAKVKPVVKGYENGGKTVVLDVDVAFVAGDRITVSGLEFMAFSAASPPDNLELDVTDDQLADAFDDKAIQIDSGASYAVSVTPDVVTTSRLPSNGTNYSVTFTVTNQGNKTDNFDLLATHAPGGTVSVVSIVGAGVSQGANPDSARITNLAAGNATVVTITYAVANVAAGTVDTLILTARSTGNPSVTDPGRLVLTVARPSLTLVKDVNPNGTVVPGTDLTYTITFSNAGAEDAYRAVVVDSLPSEVRFKVGTATYVVPPGIAVTLEFSNDGAGSWTYVPLSAGCGAPVSYDACVTHIRWTLENPLSSVAPNNSGTAGFVAQIK